ncbi:MAG: transporter [Terrimicrobiaceae bacterium]
MISKPPINPISLLCSLAGLAIAAADAKEPHTQQTPPPISAPVPATDKWQYNLFNPTPRSLMREMSTDRPDKTESAYTVDAGHFQIEATLVQFGIDTRNADGENVFGINAGNVNIKAGLTNNADFQVVAENYLYERVRSDGAATRKSGYGDTQMRLKVNLWGNDGGTTALAVMPYINWPTNTNGFGNKRVEGGIIVPLAMELPCGFGMGVMTEVDFVASDGNGCGVNFVNSITFSRDIVGNLAGYAECYTSLPDTGRDPIITLDVGLTYAFTDDILFDVGINFGVTEAAEDFNPFAGFSVRF